MTDKTIFAISLDHYGREILLVIDGKSERYKISPLALLHLLRQSVTIFGEQYFDLRKVTSAEEHEGDL